MVSLIVQPRLFFGMPQGNLLPPWVKARVKLKIKYPMGSEYLKSAVQNALAVGPSRVEPLFGEIFADDIGPRLVFRFGLLTC